MFKPFDAALLVPGYSVIDGQQYFVYPSNHGGERADALYAKRLMKTPFFAGEMGPADDMQINFANREPGMEIACAGLKKIKEGTCIFAEERFMELLTEEEIMIVLAHEAEHIRLSHSEKSVGDSVWGTPIAEFEIEADAAAVAIYGKEAVAAALLKITQLSIEEIGLNVGASTETMEEQYLKTVQDPVIVARFKALGFEELLAV